ncbi:hypothetical protein ACH9EU_08140 [Kocuria sp. M1R5S2]|uniref:hypothetical protein n=1 Tax=Kocuria rhizosphaerae TaxID=3376285 RepID=UPI003789CEFA
MREDLRAAGRGLTLSQRLLLREHLRRTETLLDTAETVQAVAPGWWRGHRSVVVVTTCRLLLVRRELLRFSSDRATIALGTIEDLAVHASPPDGARFRISVGLGQEEFSVTHHVAAVERALSEPAA